MAPARTSRVSLARSTRALILGMVFLPLAAKALSGGPIDGLVLEEGSNRPIADAIVVVRWHGDLSNIAVTQTWCYHVESTRTDPQGRFHIRQWSMPISIYTLRTYDSYADYVAYKPGYIWTASPSQKLETVLLAPVTGTVKDRFAFLQRAAVSCNRTDPSERYLYRLYTAIAKEAGEIAETEEQVRFARHMSRRAEEALVNYSKPLLDGPPPRNADPRDSYTIDDLDK